MGQSQSRQDPTGSQSPSKPASSKFRMKSAPQPSAYSKNQPASKKPVLDLNCVSNSRQASVDDKSQSKAPAIQIDDQGPSGPQPDSPSIAVAPGSTVPNPSDANRAFVSRLDESTAANFTVWFYYNDLCRVPPGDWLESFPDVKDWIRLAKEVKQCWDDYTRSKSDTDLKQVAQFLKQLPNYWRAVTSPTGREPQRLALVTYLPFARLCSAVKAKSSLLPNALAHPCEASGKLQAMVELMLLLKPSGDWIDRKADILGRMWRLQAAYDPLSRICHEADQCHHWDSVLSGYRTLDTEGFPRGPKGVPPEVIAIVQHLSRHGKPVQRQLWADEVEPQRTPVDDYNEAVDVGAEPAPPPYAC